MTDVEDRLDNDYFVSDIAESQEDISDPDYGNKTILKDVSKNLKDNIVDLEKVSSLILDKDHTLTIEQQIFARHHVISILTPIKEYVDSKIQQISEEV